MNNEKLNEFQQQILTHLRYIREYAGWILFALIIFVIHSCSIPQKIEKASKNLTKHRKI